MPSTLTDPPQPNLLAGRTSPAWDAELVDVLFVAGVYAPACGLGRGVYVGVAGSVQFVTAAGNTVTYANCPAGSIIPQTFLQILQAGTTASSLLALA